MNEFMLGADPEELRALATLFQKHSAALDQTSNDLNPTIMRARWNGPDAQRFRQDWTSRLRPQIKSASTMFTETSEKLQAQAQEQENASSEVSLGGGNNLGYEAEETGGGTSANQQALENIGTRTDQEVRLWWADLSDAEKTTLLHSSDEFGIPNAYRLAALEDKLPREDQDRIREYLVESAKGSIPMYSQSDKIGVDGQIAWVHGGAHLSSKITQNADGSVKLTLAGDISGGANTPSTKAGADVTLSGELSRTYKFNSLEEALAARAQMLNELPPDSFSRASDAITNPGEYIEKTLDAAANGHGSTDEYTSRKGTLSVGAKVDVSADVSAEAKLSLAYEQNLSDGTATASATASVKAQLDLGDGMKFGGNGEAGVTLSMDKDGDINKMTINLKGTIEGSAKVQDNPNIQDPLAELFGPKPPSEGPSAKSSVGIQGTVRMELQNTAQNQHLIDSYLSSIASGNNLAAAGDLENIYRASGVTLQANSVVSTESNLVDFNSGVASLKVGGSSETTINAGTLHKAPYGGNYKIITGQNLAGTMR
ncbi:WXG100 family type VII secretion target [Arthrobacter psychrochitiniphilus]|uniref:WXG100 family type VII secretion target n=1 Tax=Arthrobacter psychrochitiniphilus TaxID=291045 RepID=UPI003F7C8A15